MLQNVDLIIILGTLTDSTPAQVKVKYTTMNHASSSGRDEDI